MKTICFSIESSALKAALHACQEFMSVDSTRPNIQQAFAELRGCILRLTATDGASLVTIALEVTPRLADGQKSVSAVAPNLDSDCRINEASILELLTRIKHLGSKEGVFVIADRPSGGATPAAFPDYAGMVPPLLPPEMRPYFWVNAVLLSRVAKVQLLLKAKCVRVQGPVPGWHKAFPYGPTRFDVDGKLGVAVVVIMPMNEVTT